MESIRPALYQFLNKYVDEDRILLNEPMSAHTTFRVGGEAKALVSINNEEELINLIPFLNGEQEPYYVKGNGSNILVGDKGYNGIILELSSNYNKVKCEDGIIYAEAGALMSSIAKVALDNSLEGFEFASGIPGTIGGGVVMNAGAYGGELKDVVTKVRVMDPKGEILTLSNENMQFGYRTSAIKTRPFVVLSVEIHLEKGNKDAIEEKMNELNSQRRLKQPLEFPSAGSTFKRPEGYFAGKLIMDAGMRGYTIGGAQVSEKHCGFVVNKGNATAADVYEVILEVQERVKKKFNVNLEPEIIFLGTF